MTNINEETTLQETTKIGGFGFPALRYWWGRPVLDVINKNDGVWKFLRSKAALLYTTGDVVQYTPCIANISAVYCMENKIDSIHIYPRQSNMTNTVVLYIQWLIESLNGNCLVYLLTKDRKVFIDIMERLRRCSSVSSGKSSIAYEAAETARKISMGDAQLDYDKNIIWNTLDGHQLDRLAYVECPVYVIADDALFFSYWEYRVSDLKVYKDKGKDITLLGMSSLNKHTDTTMRRYVRDKLLYETNDGMVFFNDEIYYKPIPTNVNAETPAIIYTDYRAVRKDTADEFRDSMIRCIGEDKLSDTLMQELYLQYPSIPTPFIGQ